MFGDNLSDDLPAQFHEVEISQIQRLLERRDDISSDTSDEDINSDEDFDDAGEETMDVDVDDSSSDEEAEMLAERGRGAARRDPVTNDSAEWTLHQPRNVANKPLFTGTEELRVSEGCTTPYDFFKELFTVEFLEGIITAINLFATNLISNNCFANGRIHAWTPLTVAEFLIFLGILFHMGNIKLNRYSDYWRRHRLYNLFTKDYMSCNRFLLIFRCLKFGEDNLDSLFKYFNEKMTDLYSPGENLSIDESMILSRGRSGIRQYMQGKRHKYVLATPAGTALQVHMYRGKRDAEVGGQGHTDKVVSKLLRIVRSYCHEYMRMNGIYTIEMYLQPEMIATSPCEATTRTF
ncbi:piggyBac transposable element-derived protein 4-like [Cydia pomonella]|uniref:piggyBac transposable element-derived protein 4-like n=1 Tax=Cydia pomonella TaxID=82600 RepID=UPI002ADE8C91|nr:piggyBac transposable element-derived protein 4-like [Cydia pomonella]